MAACNEFVKLCFYYEVKCVYSLFWSGLVERLHAFVDPLNTFLLSLPLITVIATQPLYMYNSVLSSLDWLFSLLESPWVIFLHAAQYKFYNFRNWDRFSHLVVTEKIKIYFSLFTPCLLYGIRWSNSDIFVLN